MKIVVIAATGRIGHLVVEQALAAGHEVTAVARSPQKLGVAVPAFAVDLAAPDLAVLERAVDGSDAVISGLGPRKLSEAGITSRGTRPIVEAMHETGARRLVVVSAAPIGTVPSPNRPHPPKHDPGDGFVLRHLAAPFAKTVLRKHYLDLAVMEDMVADSGLDWTIVRPPRLTDKPFTGTYRTAFGQNPRNGFAVSRADVADCMLRCVTQPDTVKQTIGIAK
jgi:putative NADH-flavin reductase